MLKKPAIRKCLFLALSTLGGLLLLSGILYLCGIDIRMFKDWAKDLLPWLEQTNIVLFFTLMALLPLIGVPITPILIAAGLIYSPATCTVGVALSLALNISVGYLIAAKGFRSWAERIVKRAGFTLPDAVPQRHMARIILLVRLTPGMPLLIQNYSLGLLRIPFEHYFLISWPLQLMSSLGWALTSGALYQGRSGLAIMGLSLLLVGILLVKIAKPLIKEYFPHWNIGKR